MMNENIIASYPLSVNGLIKTNGTVLFKSKPPIIDMHSWLSPQKTADNRQVLFVNPGVYVVRFNEPKPKEFDEYLYSIYQQDLHRGGLHLEIDESSFEGFLFVYYTSQIEVESQLATLVFKDLNPVKSDMK